MSDSTRYDRLPATGGDGPDGDDPCRGSVLDYFEGRFGIDPSTFGHHSFWRKGAGSVWAVSGDAPDPIPVEALGLRLLRTDGRHWKPTSAGVRRFGAEATENVIELDREAAARFVDRGDQTTDWDGDWGYLIVGTAIGGQPTPIGVGLFIDGTLRSQVPKSRQIDLSER